MEDKKRIRISLPFDERLKEIEHLFLKTHDRKSLAGLFLKNVLLFLLEKKGKEETERIVHKVAEGQVSALIEAFSPFRSDYSTSKTDTDRDTESIPDDKTTDSFVDVSKFIL